MGEQTPPPDVAEAAAKVRKWLDGQQSGAPPAAKPMTDAERLDHARKFDQSKMPPNPHDQRFENWRNERPR
jgi:hypothetical protein